MKVSQRVHFLVIVCLVGISTLGISAKAQDRDAGFWTSASFEAKLVKKLTGSITEEFRFNENISELGMTFTEVGLDYKFNKHFQVSANYRFIQKKKVEDYYSLRHRYSIAVKYTKKLKPLELAIRCQFFDEYQDINRAANGGIPYYYFRNKIALKLDTKKPYTPYVSCELFSPLNYPRSVAFDNIRLSVGIDYNITKHHEIDVYYMINKEVNVSDPLTSFIFGLGYTYKL